MHLILIDNYDSFTYNLVQLFEELGARVDVRRNDRFALDELAAADALVLSPGPGIPSEAGLLLDTVRRYAGRLPILGVCLGHQAIGEVFGARLENLAHVYHGVQTPIRTVAADPLFAGLPPTLPVGRYHSWVVAREGLPDGLEVTAVSAEGHIMALRHRRYDVRGVQFHPESVLTPDGRTMLANWMSHLNDTHKP